MLEAQTIGNLYENIIVYSERSGNQIVIKFYDPRWDEEYLISYFNDAYHVYYYDNQLFKSEFLENAVMCIDEMHQINNK